MSSGENTHFLEEKHGVSFSYFYPNSEYRFGFVGGFRDQIGLR